MVKAMREMKESDRVIRFPLGNIVTTQGAYADTTPLDCFYMLLRHVQGDWGELEECDKEANDQALISGGRLLSVYYTRLGVKIYIITEADRSSTTLLLPEEY